MELSSKLVSTVFPEFHRVATFMVYNLYPTTFYQSVVPSFSTTVEKGVLLSRTTHRRRATGENASQYQYCTDVRKMSY